MIFQFNSNKKTAFAVFFEFVKFGRHKATVWLNMVAKPRRIEDVTFKGLCAP